MMRFMGLGCAALAVVFVAAGARAAGAGGKEDPAGQDRVQDSRKLLEEVLMARLTHELALDEEQTVLMVRRLAEYRETMAALRRERAQLVRALREAGMTMMVVSHEMRFAREAADRVVFLDRGEVVEEGSPERIFDAPAEARTREFLGRVGS